MDPPGEERETRDWGMGKRSRYKKSPPARGKAVGVRRNCRGVEIGHYVAILAGAFLCTPNDFLSRPNFRKVSLDT